MFKVYVEGTIDRQVVKAMFPNLNVTSIGMKSEVIERVKAQGNTIGIVDTDADFDNSQIKGIDRCIDTGKYCCMFAGVIEILNVKTLFDKIRTKVDKKFSDDKKDNINQVSNHLKNIKNAMKTRTQSRLFRTYVSYTSSRKIKYNNSIKLNWNYIIGSWNKTSQNEVSGIKEENLIEYQAFMTKFGSILDSAGINDHSFEDVIIELIKDEYDAKNLSHHIIKLIIKSDYKKRFKQKNAAFFRKKLPEINKFISSHIPK